MKTLKVALSAAGAVVVGWAFTAWADIPASAYVQRGLIAQWDGIDNAGTGTHDAAATVWKDLKGSRDLKLNANGNFSDDVTALTCVSRSSGNAAAGTTSCKDYLTIEIKATQASASSYVFCAGDTSNARMFALYNNSTFLVKTGDGKWQMSGDAPTCSATYLGLLIFVK